MISVRSCEKIKNKTTKEFSNKTSGLLFEKSAAIPQRVGVENSHTIPYTFSAAIPQREAPKLARKYGRGNLEFFLGEFIKGKPKNFQGLPGRGRRFLKFSKLRIEKRCFFEIFFFRVGSPPSVSTCNH